MIKIQKQDSIVDILNKINQEKSNDIILDFPFWHPILHNHLSLKIIQTKTRNKNLIILSNDKTAKKIAKILWIKFKKNKKENNKITTEYILKQNYTFWEYALLEIKNFFSKIKNIISWNINTNKKINNIIYLKNKYKEKEKNIIPYFILILTIIFLIFFYIYYIAINKTYITIYPEIQTYTKAKNFTFIENLEKNKDKYSYIKNKANINKITKTINISKKIWVSWIKQKNKNLSKWKVIFYNYLKEKVYLLKNTTLETKNHIQFYLPKDITIPPAKIKNQKLIAGEKKVEIFWKIKLLNWNYSWKQTNINSWVLLSIPKLDKKNKEKVFAKSITKFIWWNNNFIKYLKKEDIENAKKLLKEELKEKAIKELKKKINQQNEISGIEYDILPINNIYKFSNLSIKIPDHLKIWDEIENFNISWEITITSFIYNKQSIISNLENDINKNIIKNQEKIISIDEKSLNFAYTIKRVNDFYTKTLNSTLIKKPFIVKNTVEIEYNTIKKFNLKNNNLINEIKTFIAGKKIKQAEKFLINKKEINNVKIEVKPFFMKNISKLTENIKIEVKEP